MKTAVYIDGANLHRGTKNLGWDLDYKRLRVWLRDKYRAETAYLFIGLIPKNKDLYTALQEAGYILVYKEITYDGDGKVKGNCDADLVLRMTSDFYERSFDQAILISSDGDYAGLVKFLKEKKSFRALLSPSNNCSFLLRKLNIPIVYLDEKKGMLKKQPGDRKSPR